MFKKRGQIWVETVVYTLIGLTIIGVLLGVATPKIKSYTDKVVIEQTTIILEDIDSKISEISVASGNSRRVELRIKSGEFLISPAQSSIIFSLKESNLRYSEPGETLNPGTVSIKTEDNNGKYDITLFLNYTGINLTYNGMNQDYRAIQASTPYYFLIKNNGFNNNIQNIDIVPV